MKLLVIAAALCTFAGTAFATTVLRMEVADLQREADVVVRGRVSDMKSRWSNNRIITEVTVSVTETYKGTPGKSVTIVQPGGVVGDMGQTVHGMPQFKKDADVVLFLEQRSERVFSVVGLSQGMFDVEKSSDGKALFVVPAEVDARVLDPATQQPVAPRTQSLTLDALKTKLKATTP